MGYPVEDGNERVEHQDITGGPFGESPGRKVERHLMDHAARTPPDITRIGTIGAEPDLDSGRSVEWQLTLQVGEQELHREASRLE
jgi:hypothetical protein